MNSAFAAPWDEGQLSDSRSAFIRLLGLFVVLGAFLAALAFFLIDGAITTQRDNIDLLQRENAKLDAQIKEIASVEFDIKTLHQRQKAVEALQAVRNLPVRMLSAIVQTTPETVVLTNLVQAGMHLTISGAARSNEEVAEFLRNLEALPTHFLHPELVETVASEGAPITKDLRKALTFRIGVDLVNADNALQDGSVSDGSDTPQQKAQ
jgi:type IV pilus assembly protein PilN